MLDYPGPVLFDCVVEKHENCFPMIPSGKAHNEMLLGEDATSGAIEAGGAVLVDALGARTACRGCTVRHASRVVSRT